MNETNETVDMNVYDAVLRILTDKPQTRNSDKLLFIEFWKLQGFVIEYNGSKFLDLKKWYCDKTAVESIRRSRAEIQADPFHFDLAPTDPAVAKARAKRAEMKGSHIHTDEAQATRKDLEPVQLDLGIQAEYKKSYEWDR